MRVKAFSGCSWVCLCISNVVNTVSWKVLDVFSPNFQHWCTLGQGRTGQKINVQDHDRINMLENALFGLVNTISQKLLQWISLNFQCWCILGQGWNRQFWGAKGREQHGQGPCRRRHTELDILHQVLISSFLEVTTHYVGSTKGVAGVACFIGRMTFDAQGQSNTSTVLSSKFQLTTNFALKTGIHKHSGEWLCFEKLCETNLSYLTMKKVYEQDRSFKQHLTLSQDDCIARSFAVTGSRLWNSLLSHLRHSDIGYNNFKCQLKTFLFG